MYDGGKIERGLDGQADEAALLRELRWAELTAQLAATRDMRGAAGRKAGEVSPNGRFMSLNQGLSEAYPPGPNSEAAPEAANVTADRQLTPATVTHRSSLRDRKSS